MTTANKKTITPAAKNNLVTPDQKRHIMESIGINKNWILKVYRDPSTGTFQGFKVCNDLDNNPRGEAFEVDYYPAQKTIVYDHDAPPAAVRKAINEYCKNHATEINRKKALYAPALVNYICGAYDDLQMIATLKSEKERGKLDGKYSALQKLWTLESAAPIRMKEVNKLRAIIEDIDPLTLEQYDDYFTHVTGLNYLTLEKQKDDTADDNGND